MDILELVEKLDKSDKNEEKVNIENLGDNLGMDMDDVEQDRLKSYWIGRWYCTDQYVGYRVYYLDGNPVVISTQLGRKMEEEFKWLGKSSVHKVLDYLSELGSKVAKYSDEYIDKLMLDYGSMDEDVGSSFRIEYNDQITHHNGVRYEGEDVEIVEKLKNSGWGLDKDVNIQLGNGLVKTVEVTELDFNYNVLGG